MGPRDDTPATVAPNIDRRRPGRTRRAVLLFLVVVSTTALAGVSAPAARAASCPGIILARGPWAVISPPLLPYGQANNYNFRLAPTNGVAGRLFATDGRTVM